MDRCFIVGKGSSLKNFDFELIKDEYTICINHAVFKVPNPSAVCFCDKSFYNHYKKFIDDFGGDIIATPGTGFRQAIKPSCHGVGTLGGLFALSVALEQFETVILLGYDMVTTTEYPYFDTFDNDQDVKKWEAMDGSFKTFYDNGTFINDRKSRFDELFSEHKDRVFNCNPKSGLTTFKKIDIREVL